MSVATATLIAMVNPIRTPGPEEMPGAEQLLELYKQNSLKDTRDKLIEVKGLVDACSQEHEYSVGTEYFLDP